MHESPHNKITPQFSIVCGYMSMKKLTKWQSCLVWNVSAFMVQYSYSSTYESEL